MRLYLVRHAESELNPKRIHQKPTTPLSEAGKKQAKLLAKRLKSVRLDFIYSSPMTRARQTVEVLSNELELPVEYMEELREKKRATSMEGKAPIKEIPKEVYELIRKHRYDPDWNYEDAETLNDLLGRIWRAMQHLVKHHEGEKVLVVTHGFVLRAFLILAIFGKDIGLKSFYKICDSLQTKNTGITILDYDKENGWSLLSWNDVAHLEAI